MEHTQKLKATCDAMLLDFQQKRPLPVIVGVRKRDMESIELISELLKEKKGKIYASVDMSTGDHDASRRVFGVLCDIQVETDGSITLMFENGKTNYNPIECLPQAV